MKEMKEYKMKYKININEFLFSTKHFRSVHKQAQNMLIGMNRFSLSGQQWPNQYKNVNVINRRRRRKKRERSKQQDSIYIVEEISKRSRIITTQMSMYLYATRHTIHIFVCVSLVCFVCLLVLVLILQCETKTKMKRIFDDNINKQEEKKISYHIFSII